MSKRKAPSSENNPNHDFCDFLTELANYERNVNRNIHKFNVYRKAASVLAKHPTRITSGKEARQLEGVGAKIEQKIDEFIQTGKLRKLDKIHEDGMSVSINLFTRVSGIGPVKAKELVDAGITTLEALKLKTDTLNHHQRVGLKYFDDFEKKIPRLVVEQIEIKIRDQVRAVDPEYLITVCGSYRRGKSESGDMDVLLTHPSFTNKTASKSLSSQLLKKVVSCLEASNLITDTISLGDVKFMGVCCLEGDATARRLDLRIVPHDQFYCAVLYFTGSDIFNKEMRTHALQSGFTLNEYCLRPVGLTGVPGEAVEITSEEDIFEYIGYPYKFPAERNI